jgi:hypothetical protein
MRNSNYKNFLLLLRRFKREMQSRINAEEKMSDIQSSAFSITKKLIQNPDSVLLPAPISGTFYVEYKNYFIKFSDNSVIITNGKFSYYVWMSIKKTEQIKSIFNQELERRKTIIEKKYDNQTISNLKTIEENI